MLGLHRHVGCHTTHAFAWHLRVVLPLVCSDSVLRPAPAAAALKSLTISEVLWLWMSSACKAEMPLWHSVLQQASAGREADPLGGQPHSTINLYAYGWCVRMQLSM